MYESYYGFTEKPFTLLPDPSFLYLGETHSMALVMLEYGLLNHAGFTVITGEIGSGKTTLLRHLLNQIEDDVTVGLVSNTHRLFGELLELMLMAFGLEYRDKGRAACYEDFINFLIAEYSRGQSTVLIIDEAQNLDPETVEQLRLISNINADKDQLLQLILVGQHQLRTTLRRPELHQFAQRIAVDYHLEALDFAETQYYIHHRIKTAGGEPSLFGEDACRVVHAYSRGIPRLINVVCDTALVYGCGAKRRTIDPAVIHEVVKDKAKGGLFKGADQGPREFRTVTDNLPPDRPLPDNPFSESQPPDLELGADEDLMREIFTDLRDKKA